VRVAPQAAAAILQRLQLLVDAASTPPKLEPAATLDSVTGVADLDTRTGSASVADYL
jgi:hypothetical protein